MSTPAQPQMASPGSRATSGFPLSLTDGNGHKRTTIGGPSRSPLRALAGGTVAVLVRPRVRTFAARRQEAHWATIWIGVAALAVVQGLAVAIATAGPGAAGVSSLPIGPKLHLPHAPLWLGLMAFAGSFAEFFLFSALLLLSARLFGGRGSYLAQSYLIVLFWLPLFGVSAVASLFETPGSIIGLLARLYALVLLAPALAAAHHLSLARAWGALLAVVAVGLLLGVVALTVAVVHVADLMK